MKYISLTLFAMLLSIASYAVLPIAGPSKMCVGQSTLFSDATTGGSWTTSSTTVATINPITGNCVGIAQGTVIISYTVSGISATTSLTVNPLAPVTGTAYMCVGTITVFSDTVSGGNWSSAITSIATVGVSTGLVTGVSGGLASIIYTLPTGCIASRTVTVNPLPAPIIGPTVVCSGATISLSSGTVGGAWASSNSTTASITGFGVVTGHAAGTVTITYALGCITTTTVTVGAISPISGPGALCIGSSAPLSDGTTGGTWSSSNTSVAIVGSVSGLISGIHAGTTTITYSASGGCAAYLTVNIRPLPSPISGPAAVCSGQMAMLTDAVPGGTWSSNNPTIADFISGPSSGVITGISGGITTATYTVGVGCYITTSLTVNPLAPIIGPNYLCVGTKAALIDTIPGGSWTSSNTAIAVVSPGTDTAFGILKGFVTFTYTTSKGCVATHAVTVNAVPLPITGSSYICLGQTQTYSNATPGGAWSSSNPVTADFVSPGILMGYAAGTSVISYSLGGCSALRTVTAVPLPSPISPAAVCVGQTTILMGSGAGTWSCSNTSIAIIGSTSGIVTGISPGTSTIDYILPTGCYSSATFTVNPLPASIRGLNGVCIGSSITLSDATSGGSWSSYNPTIANVTGSGVVTGYITGTAGIVYTILATGCSASLMVTSGSPSSISGAKAMCVATSTTLADGTSGGIWSSSNTTIAIIGSGTGMVNGIAAGTAAITYSVSGGCEAYSTVTVYPMPGAITGSSIVCQGATTSLTDATPGGTWSSLSPGTAIVTAGIVTGISFGTTIISYSFGGICTSSKSITVNPLPASITGVSDICVGQILATLTDATPGGTWSSYDTTVIKIDSVTALCMGFIPGTSTISYTIGNGCFTRAAITVFPPPSPIIGAVKLCTGLTTTLSDATPGGVWISGNTAIATVSTGIVNGISTGTSTIDYMIPSTGCNSFVTVIVYTMPTPITGLTNFCAGASTTLSDAITGGAWSSSNTTIATVSSGIVTGISTGTASIIYTTGGSCNVSATVTVNPLPAISASSSSMCSDVDTLAAIGGARYSWSPSTGLSCATCATTSISPSANTTYTVTGTSSVGCSDIATVKLNGDRIFGHITFSSYTPDTLDMKVWLIQYNPVDSSISALDSTMTCVVDSITYYEFDTKPTGNYLVKAMMLYDNSAGSSGYVPTYGLSSLHWDSATTITHTAGMSDSLHITMVNGTVPSGPGFISGYVYSGAGKGTTGDAPVSGMIIFLENTTSQLLSHTYTDVNGYYSFSNLANGDYIIYPEDYIFKTTTSAIITLSDALQTVNNVDFRQYLTSKIITPYDYPNGIKPITITQGLEVYPNPNDGAFTIEVLSSADAEVKVVIINMIGEKVKEFTLKTNKPVDIKLYQPSGVYFISAVTANGNSMEKIIVR